MPLDDPYAAAGISLPTPDAAPPPSPGAGYTTPDLVPIYTTNPDGTRWVSGYERPPGWTPPTTPSAQPGGGSVLPQRLDTPAKPAPPEQAPPLEATVLPTAPTKAPVPVAPPSPTLPGTAPPTGLSAPQTAQHAPDPDDPYSQAGLTPPPPEQRPLAGEPPVHKDQELRDQPWYQGLWDHVGTAFRGIPAVIEHGPTLGYDDVVAPIPAAIYRSIAQGIPFPQAYADVQNRYQDERRAFAIPNPNVATSLEVAGNYLPMMAAGPLFAPARAGAVPLLTRAADYARNVGAASGLGAVTGFGMTEGDLGKRAEGAAEGAVVSGGLQAAFPPAAALVRTIAQQFRPSAQVPRLAGQIFNEAPGGHPVTFRGSPLPPNPATGQPGVPLNVAEAASGPGQPGIAAMVDKRYAENVAEMHRLRDLQNQGLLAAMPREPTEALPPQAAAEASEAATRRIQQAQKISDTEEKRLWNQPTLTDKEGVSTGTAKEKVESLVRTMRGDEPGLALALDESPLLRRTIGQLYRMPQKAAANQINAISSRLRKIARDPNEKNDVKHIATRLAGAVQDGIWEAPEVAGREPTAFSDVDLGDLGLGGGAPTSTTGAAAQARWGGVERPPTKPESLVDFLIAKGGVRPHSDLAENLKDIHYQQGGRLIRTNGMTVHDAREAARDALFFTGDKANDDRTLINALNEEAAGRPHYRPEDEAQVNAWREYQSEANRRAAQMEDYRWQLQAVAEESGGSFTAEEMNHALTLMVNNPMMHPQEALMQAARAGEQDVLQRNAQRSAFTPPGMEGATQGALPDQQVFRDGVPPNPQLVKDLKAARAFTRREAEVFGHASFDNILRRNSYGNETVTPGTALNKFFDFAAGVERPGAIKDVARFMDDIKSEWLKLDAAARSGKYDPDMVDIAKNDLVKNSRDFIIAKMLGAVSSKANIDSAGQPMIIPGKLVNFLNVNRRLMEQSGMFNADQLGVIDALHETAKMIQRGRQTGVPVGSPTFTRLQGKRWVDVFTGPLLNYLGSASVGSALMGTVGHVFGEGALGAILGAEGNVGTSIMERLYATPRERLLAAIDSGIRDPEVAKFLMQNAAAAPRGGVPEPVRQWLRALLAISPTGEMARSATQPTQTTTQGIP